MQGVGSLVPVFRYRKAVDPSIQEAQVQQLFGHSNTPTLSSIVALCAADMDSCPTEMSP